MKSTPSNTKTYIAAVGFGVLASPAVADPGHIEFAGHDHSHLLALGAVCVALIVGGFGVLHSIKIRQFKAVD